MTMNYLVFTVPGWDKEEERMVLFGSQFEHQTMYNILWTTQGIKMVSAGHITQDMTCTGKSTSLGYNSRPEDTELFRRTIGLSDGVIEIWGSPHNDQPTV